MNWTDLGDYEDISSFVVSVSKQIEYIFGAVKESLNEIHLNHLICTIPSKVSEAFISYFYKIKKIDESGAQKLWTDLFELKSLLTKILSSPEKSSEDSIFNKTFNIVIKNNFNQIESRLKCLSSNVEEIGNVT